MKTTSYSQRRSPTCVIAAGLTNKDIDRLIDEARAEARPLLG